MVSVGERGSEMPSIRNPITFSATPPRYQSPPPGLDEHGAEIRKWLSEGQEDQ